MPSVGATSGSQNLPKIGGTFGGFIALVVSLAAIFLISCIAVFFLIRTHKPDDPYERYSRRILFGRRPDSLYEAPTGTPGLKAKLKGFFPFGKKSQGWVRANSGDDEWDAGDNQFTPPRELKESDIRPLSAAVAEARARGEVNADPLAEPAELSAPPSSERSPPPLTASRPVPPASYTDPFASSPSGGEISGSSHERQSIKPVDEGRFSIPSPDLGDRRARSMRKFPNGTKFKEVIDS